MFKRIKSITAVMLAVVMLTSICCVPAMASERNVKEKDNINLLSEEPWWFPVNVVQTYSGAPTLVNQQMLLASRYFSESVKGVLFCVKCNVSTTAKVTFRLENVSTHKVWRFTATGNDQWAYSVFTTDLPAGNYNIWSESVTHEGAYTIQLKFCNPK